MQEINYFSNQTVLDTGALAKHRQRFSSNVEAADYAVREAADRLFMRLDYIKLMPKEILLFGWQTDYEYEALSKRYPDATILVVSDMAAFAALRPASVQLVIANMSLQWLTDPQLFFFLVQQVLVEEGLLLFTTVGPDTLGELYQSFQAIDEKPHVHTFTDMHHLGDCMKQLGFDDPVVDMQMLTLAYESLNDLFEDLRLLAATNIHFERHRGLYTKKQWQQMLAAYEQFKQEDYYPVTLELICGQAWKVAVQPSGEQEISVPITQLRRT